VNISEIVFTYTPTYLGVTRIVSITSAAFILFLLAASFVRAYFAFA